jgi:hypothetical protein
MPSRSLPCVSSTREDDLSVPTLRITPAMIALALMLVAGVSACGESDAKRAADARSEVVDFFAANAPVVAFLRPGSPTELAEVDRAANSLPAWQRLRAMVLGPLHAAGLGRAHLLRLVRPRDEVEGLDAAALALGAATPEDLTAGRPLLVLATDQSDLLSEFMQRASRRGTLMRAGTLHDAALYEGRDASFAARDGVLVSAPTLAEVRTAILRRDGDSDEQLDGDVVRSLFDELGEQGPLLVYADLAAGGPDPGLRALRARKAWIGRLGQTAASLTVTNGALQIEVFAKTTSGDFAPSEVPIGSEPTPFYYDRTGVAAELQHGSLRDLLLGLAPISGEATATSDEVRVHATVGG